MVDAGMTLDSGRFVDLAQHGLALGRLQMLLAAGPAQAQAVYERMLSMAHRGHAKQADADPDLLRESTHLVLLAAELGLAVEPEAYAEATAWLSQLTELQPKDAGAAQL
ncbi:MAG: hypothetical protein KDI56_15190, partial [Xanthomonadales bacterium]|nr:hypothetical protein [Xanthomonadales bacterium]